MASAMPKEQGAINLLDGRIRLDQLLGCRQETKLYSAFHELLGKKVLVSISPSRDCTPLLTNATASGTVGDSHYEVADFRLLPPQKMMRAYQLTELADDYATIFGDYDRPQRQRRTKLTAITSAIVLATVGGSWFWQQDVPFVLEIKSALFGETNNTIFQVRLAEAYNRAGDTERCRTIYHQLARRIAVPDRKSTDADLPVLTRYAQLVNTVQEVNGPILFAMMPLIHDAIQKRRFDQADESATAAMRLTHFTADSAVHGGREGGAFYLIFGQHVLLPLMSAKRSDLAEKYTDLYFEQELKRAATRLPGNSHIPVWIGMYSTVAGGYYHEKHFDDAVRLFEKCAAKVGVSSFPLHALISWGQSEFQRGRKDRARIIIGQAIDSMREKSKSPLKYTEIITGCSSMQNLTEFEDLVQQAVAVVTSLRKSEVDALVAQNPALEQSLTQIARMPVHMELRRAREARLRKEYVVAEQHSRAAIASVEAHNLQHEPIAYQAHWSLGHALARQKRKEEARAEYAKAVEILKKWNPEHPRLKAAQQRHDNLAEED